MRSFFPLLAASIITLAASRAGAEAAAENWATARARALTEQGVAHRNAGSTDLAVTRFNEAIAIDSTFGPAYLALASLREGSGDSDEALHVLDLAFERISAFEDGLAARADILARAKHHREATAAYLKLLELKTDDEPTLKKLVEVAARAALLPVALGASRRLAYLAKERGDAAAEKDARITTRALEKLIAEADPVSRGRSMKDAVRRAIAKTSGK